MAHNGEKRIKKSEFAWSSPEERRGTVTAEEKEESGAKKTCSVLGVSPRPPSWIWVRAAPAGLDCWE